MFQKSDMTKNEKSTSETVSTHSSQTPMSSNTASMSPNSSKPAPVSLRNRRSTLSRRNYRYSSQIRRRSDQQKPISTNQNQLAQSQPLCENKSYNSFSKKKYQPPSSRCKKAVDQHEPYGGPKSIRQLFHRKRDYDVEYDYFRNRKRFLTAIREEIPSRSYFDQKQKRQSNERNEQMENILFQNEKLLRAANPSNRVGDRVVNCLLNQE